ncbi:hypothetical protein BJV74DRAFT_568838 [Russula compacta]|nr:hypothetical protein BJV74DRAFT_568838 [Russula compacta]
MGPRPSISGELPIDSYFGSTGKTAGTIGNKDNDLSSLKRRAGATADNENRTSTKKQKTKQHAKGTNFGIQEKSHSVISAAVRARPNAIPNASGTTSIPTPISVVKLPRSTSSRKPADIEVITVTSSSPPRATPLNAGDAVDPAGDTVIGSSLPTPRTVSHEGKKNHRTNPAARLPTAPAVSQQSGPVTSSILLRPPLTPTHSKTKPNHISLAYRTTPHSQRVVPSSQWSDDEQPNSTSSFGPNRDPFFHAEEPDSCREELTLPSHLDAPSRLFSTLSFTPVKLKASTLPTFTEPSKACSLRYNPDHGGARAMKMGLLSLSSPSQSGSLSSSARGPQDQRQISQIEPTSQFDEIELKISSQSLPCPVLPPQTNHCDMALSVEQCSHMFVVPSEIVLMNHVIQVADRTSRMPEFTFRCHGRARDVIERWPLRAVTTAKPINSSTVLFSSTIRCGRPYV